MFFLYYNKHDGKWPAPEKWCDVLQEEDILRDTSVLICPGAKEQGRAGRVSYAMNPNCRPDSPPKTVLVFDADGGWNKHGGPELLVFDHHKDIKNKRHACILYKDGSAEWIEPNQVDTLNWAAGDEK